MNFAAFYLHEALPDAPGGRVLSPGTVKADPLDVIRGGRFGGHMVR